MSASKLDEKLSDEAGLEEGEAMPLSRTMGEAVYWLVFLLFLPAVLGALHLDGLLGTGAGNGRQDPRIPAQSCWRPA